MLSEYLTRQKGWPVMRHRFSGHTRLTSAVVLGLAIAVAGLLARPASSSASTGPSPGAGSASAVTAGLLAGDASGGGRYLAVIQRTEYGIPHILADNYASLGYGYGYAFAQDNLCVLADRVITLRGERSEFFGPAADSGDTLGASTDNLDSDIYYRAAARSGVLARLLARPAPFGPTAQARQLVDGYAAGYDRYLRDTGVAHLPDPTCRGQAWVTPITPMDVWRLMYDIDTLNGSSANKQGIATAQPPSASSASVGASALAALVPPAGQASSNGWALGRDATTGRDGMVLANPHLPWTGNARFYQVQLTIPGQLNVSGASLYGTPVIEIGHTQGLAWTHTVSHAQRYTLYRLTLVPGDPTSYLVDGHAVAMTRQAVSVTERGTGGKLSTVTRTLYGSRFGPLLAQGWTTANAFAIDDANADNLRSVNEWLAMDRSQDLAQLRRAQDTYQGLPWVYTIAADSSGTAYFADATVAPHVTTAELNRCQVDKNLGHNSDGNLIILNGSTSACGWGSDPDAIEPGIFGPRNYPKLTRTDYVADSNNSPWQANPNAPLTGYPPVYDTRQELELRPRLSLNMIAERIAGTDGYGPPGFTLATLQQTMLGERNYSADLARGAVVAMCRAHPVLTASDGTAVNVSAACGVLARWDGRADPGSRGEILWRQAYGQLDYTDSWWSVPFDPAHPLTTPRDLDTAQPAVRAALADAVEFFGASHIPLDISVGATQHYAGVPLGGCTEGEGCFDRDEGDPAAGDPVGTAVNSGSSFIMAVELTRQGPRARTILTYSESANPDSPHYADQTRLYSRHQWVTERFTQAQIGADPGLQVTVLRG
jgi:acyl-homoserine-lactone acylase